MIKFRVTSFLSLVSFVISFSFVPFVVCFCF